MLMGYGCSPDPAANMAFDDVEYVTSFPEVIELDRGREQRRLYVTGKAICSD